MTTYYIYKIYCNDENITDTYIGSTQNITTRKYYHKRACNNQNDSHHNLKVYQMIRANGGWDNWNFIVIEEIKECSKVQAHIREEYHRQEVKANMNSICCFSGVTDYSTIEEYKKKYREVNKEQLKLYFQQYREDNIEKIKLQKKQYRDDNKEEIKLHKQQYYENNKQKIQQYREDNKEHIKEYKAQRYTCECGSVFSHDQKSRHFKTKKHKNYLANLKELIV
jgi:hypothetical protein